ncbi:MAG: AbrB/MazE/SpoVT family DNA-binding domain-containing protein [Clostridia bacterium]
MKKEVIIDLGNTRGVSRKIDELGRIVLPIEYRKELSLNVKDSVEMFLLEDGIYIKKN